jgi:hypothetical protein
MSFNDLMVPNNVPNGLHESDNPMGFVAELRHTREQFIRSKIFHNLARDLRCRLYQDGNVIMRRMASCMGEVTFVSSTNMLYEATFSVHWPLGDFMRAQYGTTPPPLGTVLTVSG